MSDEHAWATTRESVERFTGVGKDSHGLFMALGDIPARASGGLVFILKRGILVVGGSFK
jgi:hypothetical protein